MSRQSSVLFRAPEPELSAAAFTPACSQRRHLVFHQRDEGRDDETNAWTRQGWNLVAERLASAGRHQDEGVVAGNRVLDDPPAVL